jgi:hypothetical protein
MLKTLFRGKNGITAVAVTAAVALLAAVLYITTIPVGEVAANEASDVAPEPQVVATADIAVIEPDGSEEEPLPPPETEVLEIDTDGETIEEEADTINEETEENSEEGGNDEEDSQEQPQYIGRQPTEGYVEPESGDDRFLKYKDTYQSNIVVIVEEIWSTDYRDYAWFHPTAGAPRGATAEIFDFVAYAILTYYDGDVPCDYSFKLEEDCRNMTNSKIFEIQTHGERPLNICLDMYNWKICVEEGIVERGLTWAEQHGG